MFISFVLGGKLRGQKGRNKKVFDREIQFELKAEEEQFFYKKEIGNWKPKDHLGF